MSQSDSTVVDLREWKERNSPHLSGAAVCFKCKHEWVGVAPVGSVALECPACGCFGGVFRNQVEREGLHYVCNCGNAVFCITPDETYCPMCGMSHRF